MDETAQAAPPAATGNAPGTPRPPTPAPDGRLRVVHHRLRWVRERSPVQWLGIAAAVCAGGLLLAALGWYFCWFRGCPNVQTLSSYRPDGAPVLLDRDGEPFAELKPTGHRVVELESLPDYLPAAFVAVEDRRFRSHHGVDWNRVGGALAANLRAGGIEEGSSTITMQLARNVFPDRLPGEDRTVSRKLLEMRVAQDIEHHFSKDDILEMYLNYIYFGGGARGIDAASHFYFDQPPQELTLPQAALLAALPKAPTHYDPRRHPERAEERRNLVLELMVDQGKLSAEEAENAKAAPLGVTRRPGGDAGELPFAPYFVEEVRRQLEARFGDSIYATPLRIRTTLDRTAQTAAEEELRRQLGRIERGAWGRFRGKLYSAGEQPEEVTQYLQGAAVVLDADTGDVLAWVGGRDFRQSRFDRVEDARRQVGSAFKPFVYATALAQGHPLSERLVDQPLTIPLDRRHSWTPKNFTGRFEGSVSMREALVHSKNVPTVRLAQEVGTNQVARTAGDIGLPGDRIPRTPAMALGTAALSPLEMATAYTAFASLGNVAEPRLVLQVEKPDGEVIWTSEPETRRVLDPAVAFLLTDALEDVVRRGTGARVRSVGFRGPAAGKTGTTNDRFDTWFVGFTPEMVGAVWIGFDHPQTIVPDATGGRLAAPVWGRMMRRVYAGRPTPSGWRPPGDVVEHAIDPASGMLLASGCYPVNGPAVDEYFLLGTEPRSICPSQQTAGLGVPDAEDDWRTRFRDWLDSWGTDDEAAGEPGEEILIDEDGDGEGIRVSRGEDGSVRMDNTGRRTDLEPILGTGGDPGTGAAGTDGETGGTGSAPVERQPLPRPQRPPAEPPPEETGPGPIAPAPVEIVIPEGPPAETGPPAGSEPPEQGSEPPPAKSSPPAKRQSVADDGESAAGASPPAA